MASSGIKDRVAIVGMGCTRFGELWDKGVDDLLIDAATEATASAGVAFDDIDAYWLGTMTSGFCGVTLSRPLKIDYRPVTRVENYCATGSEAFRNACYAVASGAYDTAMAIGVEKLKDTGYSGLTGIRPVGDGTDPGLSSPAAFSLRPLAPLWRTGFVHNQRASHQSTPIALLNRLICKGIVVNLHKAKSSRFAAETIT